MPSELYPIQVEFTPEFKRNLRALAKKYQHIRSDVQPAIEQIQSGQFAGDRIQGTQYVVFKVRVRNRDIPKGKSAGYRLIYSVPSSTQVVLITIYSKLEQSDISSEQIRRILLEHEDRTKTLP
jgi:mRNA-degrading endonuclease RelE of RelBE toxin-antitoxin system